MLSLQPFSEYAEKDVIQCQSRKSKRTMFWRKKQAMPQDTTKKTTKPKSAQKGAEEARPKLSLLSLESRLMFDAAATATAAEVNQEQVAQEQAEAAVSGDSGTSETQASSENDALLSAISTYMPAESRTEIVFVDPTVPNYQDLLSGLDPSIEVIMLDGGQDGIEQMAGALAGRTGIDAIHLISHGEAGALQLGTGTLTVDTMSGQYSDELAAIQQALSDQADILVYGCDFAEGQAGQDAVSLLSQLTGADVAASTDDTGYAGLGGDWDLEFQVGTVEAQGVIDYDTQADWVGLLSLTASGGETRVNTTTTGTQTTNSLSDAYTPDSVAMDANGNYVTVWESAGNIYGQRYNSAGTAQGSEFVIASNAANERLASVAMNASGAFVVTWERDQGTGDYDIYARLYNSSGTAVGSEFLVNEATTYDQEHAHVAMAADGSFVVVFESNAEASGTYYDNIYAQRYDATGTKIGSNFLVNTTTAGDQNDADIAMDSAGNFVVVWAGERTAGGSAYSIYGQRYNTSGVAQGGEFLVNAVASNNDQHASVAMNDSGNFVVTWDRVSGSDADIQAQRFNSSGVAQGSAISVTNTTSYFQEISNVSMDQSGNFVVSWSSNNQDGSGWGVYTRQYDSTGTSLTTESRVATTTTNSQDYSGIAYQNGKVVVTWSGNGTGDSSGIFMQRYDATAPNSAPVLADTVLSITVTEDAGAPSGAVGSLISTFTGGITDADNGAYKGIAITGTNETNGTWYYTTNGGTTWTAVGTVSTTSALLLADNANTRLYFAPGANYNGTVSNAITLRAWDQTSGSNGARVSLPTSSNTVLDSMSSASFSNNNGTANWSGSWIESDASGSGATTGSIDITSGYLRFRPTTVGNSLAREVDLSTATSATFSFSMPATFLTTGQILVQVSSNGGSSYTTLETITSASATGTRSYDISSYMASNTRIRFYSSATDSSGIRIDDVQVQYNTIGGGSSAYSTATDTIALTVTAVNDGPSFTSLNGTPTYTEGGSSVVLDSNVTITDTELTAANNFTGATLTLSRNGGADSQDVFSGSGTLSLSGGNVVVSGTTIGTYTNSGGTLIMTFNSSATNTRVNSAMQQIAYSNSSDVPPSSVQINWTFSDNNSGGQGTGGGLSATGSVTVSITAVNDAPVLADTALTLTVAEDAGAPSGAVGSLISAFTGGVTEPDGSAAKGIAITGTNETNGMWYYTTNGGTTWTTLGAVSDSSARLLAADANTRLYFQPNANYNGTSTNAITFHAWDQTSGTNGGTANLNASFSTISEDFSSNNYSGGIGWAGNWVEVGEATNSTTGNVSIGTIGDVVSGGGNYLHINLVAGTGIERAVDLSGATTANISFYYEESNSSFGGQIGVQAWDGTTWTTLQTINIDTTNYSGSNGVSTGAIDIPNPSSVTKIRLYTVSAASGDTIFIDNIQISGTGGSGTGGTTAFSSATDTVDVTVTAVNDAPVLADTALTLTVAEDAGAPSGAVGSTISSFTGGITDVDSGASKGIAITGTNETNGTWYYTTNGGTTWTAVGSVSNTSALLLADNASTRLYFAPGANYNGTSTGALTLRAWDQTSGTAGTKVTTASNGGTTAFSSATDTVNVTVTAVNDTPTDLSLSANTVAENAANGMVVGTVSGTDPDSGDTKTYSFTDSAGGRFAINSSTGQITVANGSLLNYEAATSHTVTVRVTDSGGLTYDETFTINVTNVNEAPTGANATVTINEDTSHTLTTANFGFSDVDAGDSLSAVRIDSLPGAGTLRLSGIAVTVSQVISSADITAGNLVFTPAANANGTGYASFTFSVRDSNSTYDTTPNTLMFNVTAVNDAPTISYLAGDSQTYSEGDGAVIIEYGLDSGVQDVDSYNFDTGTLTVSIPFGGDSAEDVLSIRHQGTAGGQIGVSGSTVSYQGVTIGTFTGGTSGNPLVITFNSNATVAAVDVLVLNITYRNTDTDAPTTGARTVRFALTDGDGGTSANYDTTITVTAVNDTPTDLALSANTVAENAANGTVVGTISGTDPDTGDTKTYSFTDSAGGRFAINSSTGQITVADGSLLNYEAATSHSVTVRVTDSGGLTYDETFTINLTNVNETPTDLALSGNTVAENAANGTVVGTVSGTDPDSGDTKAYSFTDSAGGRFSINSSTGVITVANSSLLNYEAATSHSVTVRVTDSGGLTYDETFTINLTNVNEAPTGADATVTINEDTSHTLTTANFGFSDVDAGDSLSAVRIDSLPGAGTLRLSGVAVTAGQVISVADISAGNLVFTPAANANGTGYASFTFSVRDSSSTYDTTPNTFTVNVTAVNDAPVNTVSGAQTVAVDTPLAISGLSVSDVDGNLTTVQLSVTNGTIDVTLSGGAAISSGASGTSTVTLTGTQADINATLSSLTYQGNSLFTGTDTLTMLSTDGNGATDSDSVQIAVSNNAPTNVLPAAQTAVEDTPLAITGLSVTDGDGNLATVQLSAVNGTLVVTLSGGATISSGANGSNSVTLSGSQADLNATLTSLTYQGNADFSGSDTLTITSTDSLGTADTDNLSITVTPVNETPTDLALSANTVAENAANGMVVGTVAGTDPDPGDTKSYSFTDSAGGRFAINSATGQITVADSSLLNYEAATSHSVTVRVTDSGGLTYDKTFTINLTDVNETPTLISLSNNTVAENAANGTVVGTASTTDPDAGDTHTYSLLDSAGGRFTIDSNTGVITVADGSLLDYDSAASHNLTIRTTDAGGLTHDQAVTINLTNVNETPTDLALSANTVAENAANGTVVGSVTGTDPDSGDTKTYSFTDSAGGRFAINSSTGQITVANSSLLNYEAATSHSVTVRVTDSGGLTYDETFTINVTNVNEAPTGADATVTINEDSSHTLTTANFGFSDVDAGDSLSAVRIDSLPGAGSLTLSGVAVTAGQVVTVADLTAGNLVFTPAANANGAGYASFTFSVRDSNNAYDSLPNTLTVDVTAVNDAPVVTPIAPDVTFVEDGLAQVIDATGTITDVDSANFDGGVLTVAVTQNGSADDRLLIGNFGTGPGQVGTSGSNVTYEGVVVGTFTGGSSGSDPLVITFNGSATPAAVQEVYRSIQFNNGSHNPSTATRQITFGLTDGDGGTATPQTKLVYVQAIDDAPTDLSLSGNLVAENAANGTVVGTVMGTDPDTGDTLTYSFTDSAGGRFTINSSTGQITVANGSLLNYEAATSHSVTVRVTDSGGLTYDETFTINLTDINEAPTLIGLTGTTVVENAANGTVVGTASTTDPDAGDTHTYSLLDDAGGRFAIDSNTGIITVADGSLLDYDSAASHGLTIRATDAAGLTYDQAVTINLTDVNETPTDLALSANTVAENAANGTVVGIVSGTDPDSGDTKTYSFTDSAGGRFAINSSTGEITVADSSLLNYEAATNHLVTVRVTDSGGLTYDETFTITLTNVNETPTDLALSANTVAEDATNGTVVGTVTGTDSDSGDTQTYSFIDSAGGRFAINSSTGEITVADSSLLDYESATSHTVTVRVTDSGGLTYDETFTINLTDVNEAPTGADATITINEDTAHTLTTADFGFSDVDAGDSLSAVRIDSLPGTGTLTLSGVAVTAGQVISVANLSAGNLVFTPAADTSGTGYASFTFSVRDSNNDYDAAPNILTIDVTAVNDAPVVTANTGTTVAEGGTDTIDSSELAVSDVEQAAAQLTYSIGTGPAYGRLELTTAPGVTATTFTQDDIATNRLIYIHNGSETTSDSFTFTVNDGDGGSLGLTTVTLTITPVNDAPTIMSNGGGATAAISVAENVSAVTVVTGADVDLPAQTLAYSISGGIDQALFTINAATGALTFTAPPDFEVATDANGDNVYVVQVQVVDSQGASTTQTIQVTVTDVVESVASPPVVPPILLTPTPPPPSGGPTSGPGTPPADEPATVSDPTTVPPEPTVPPMVGSPVSMVPLTLVPSSDRPVERVPEEPRKTEEDAKDRPLFFVNDDQGRPLYSVLPVEPAPTLEPEPPETTPSVSDLLMAKLDEMAVSLEQAVSQSQERHELMARVAAVTGTTLSVGFVAWALRSGAILASMLATMPAWQHFDPLPVVKLTRNERKHRRDEATRAQQQEAAEFKGLNQVLDKAPPLKRTA